MTARTPATKVPATPPPPADRSLDRIDRRLLARLQQDGRAAISQLAREVHLTVTPTLERVRRLESGGYIEGYFARLNPRRLGLGLLAYVEVSLDRFLGDRIAALRGVQQTHTYFVMEEVKSTHRIIVPE